MLLPITPLHSISPWYASLIPCIPGVFFYLSSAVNPIIYNLLSHRFRAAFRNVISPSCKQWHSQHHPQELPAQRNIFLTECHLVEVTEEAGPQFPCHVSTCSCHVPTVPCTGRVPWKKLSRSWYTSLPPHCREGLPIIYIFLHDIREVKWLLGFIYPFLVCLTNEKIAT